MELAKNNSISLRLEGDKITSDKFSDGLRTFYKFVDEVAFKIFGKKHPIKWIVSVNKGSIDIKNKPELVNGFDEAKQNEYFSVIQRDIDILEKKVEYPTSFNDKALGYLKELAMIPDRKNGIARIDIIIDEKKNTLTPKIITNIDALLNVFPKAISSVTGRLSTLTERQGFKIVVYDDRTQNAVDCFINEEFLKNALELFGKRVYVYGLVNYDSRGRPKNIAVKKLEKFGDEQRVS